MLMMSGFDRYYQIVRCFRDEDLRADRQPEFTQLDIETSFLDEEDILQIMEPMVRGIFKQHLGVELADPFPRMTYREAMRRYRLRQTRPAHPRSNWWTLTTSSKTAASKSLPALPRKTMAASSP